ncbi:ATP-binding cassette domain-containing protein [Cryobacterium sp. TMT1-3]|uniref:ATP-binding cassette domain-containing protein n=1 Tax=Cryobacterium luteum TaxID=1424661 RepID=A0A1H8GC69_9MICO|nr:MULTISPECIES: ATP-binding cassette domain-containing protein [Cryobacterium]TFB93931.1 ATP-binding cassette domain-containing protein [Cryobacterium luteum]TFC29941.1 ATP-binding cassette domain-containing protein [Cryobacterium sp. TMT1-3]SEN41429.1 iron complex transport system ATP-binding protein [Cryobacterium luteum]
MIDIVGVTKTYGSVVVVDDVDLRIPAGGITSIIGANGAGKSTLISMVSRLLTAERGTITVDGHDVAATKSDELARRLAILRQENHLAARLTVRDLVAFGRYPHSRGRLTTLDRAQIEQAIDYLDLDALTDRYLDELSGGQRQRAFVAMVLCQNTDYVLLDEPLNNLDMSHAVEMMRILRRAADELGKTIVMVVHDINFASTYSDHIVAMKDGRVLHQGPPADVIEPGPLREIFGIDVAVHVIDGHRIGVYYS